jgi:hypothetical protein
MRKLLLITLIAGLTFCLAAGPVPGEAKAKAVYLEPFSLALVSPQNVSNYREQGGARWVIGGSLDVASGGELDIESGGSLLIAGVDVTTSIGAGGGVTAGTVTASKMVIVDTNKDIATFRNLTASNLYGATVTAGSDGTAGTITVYPVTANKGTFSLTCTAQTGDTAVIINADAMGQASTFHLSDPGAAAAYLVASTAALTLAEVDVLDAVTAGTVTASKALVVDASRDIATLGNVTLDGNLVTGSTTLSETELGYLDGLTIGAVTASKALVVDASRDLATIHNLTGDGLLSVEAELSGGANVSHLIKKTNPAGETYSGTEAGLTIKAYDEDATVTHGSGENAGLAVFFKPMSDSGTGGENVIATFHKYAGATGTVKHGVVTYGDMTNGYTLTGGTSDYCLNFENQTASVAEMKASTGNAMKWAAAAPGSGTWAQGDIVWNTGAAASGTAGWVCVVAGTPGTWETFGISGSVDRADLAEDALAVYGINLYDIRAADLAPLGDSESAGDHFYDLSSEVVILRGEEAISETEASVSCFTFTLPPEYVAAGDVKVRINSKVAGLGTLGTCTVDIEAYEQADGAVGSDICATVAQAITGTYANDDFTITATGLVAGDTLTIKITTSVQETAGTAIEANIDKVALLLDIKG